MNKQEIINKIREIFGSVKEQFEIVKSTEGVEFRIDGLEMEKEIYIITPEGELPAPEGSIELEDGTKLRVQDGKIKSLEIKEEVEEMADAELADGTKITNKGEGDFAEGQKCYVVDAEGNEVPCPEGEHTTKSGITLVVDGEGIITGIKRPDEEGEGSLEDMGYDEKKMAEATLIDGTIVETDGDLEVGADLFVKTEEGRQPANDGEHETEDGMVVVVEDGKIVEIKEKEVQEEIKVEEVMETFMEALTNLKEEIATIRKENEELNNQFSKFKAEPAGTKIYDGKGAYIKEKMAAEIDKLERLAELRRFK